MIETFRDRLSRVIEAHARSRADGDVHRGTLKPDPAEHAEAVALQGEVDRLRAVLADVLGNFYEKGHPGYEGIRTGWVRVDQYARWQLAARGVSVDALRRGGLAVLDDAPPAAHLAVARGRFWCCPEHPTASVRNVGGVARCLEPDCRLGPPASGSDGGA